MLQKINTTNYFSNNFIVDFNLVCSDSISRIKMIDRLSPFYDATSPAGMETQIIIDDIC